MNARLLPVVLRLTSYAIVGAVLAMPLEMLLHLRWPTAAGVFGGVLGAVLPPALLGPSWSDLPRFLQRGLDLSSAAVGVLAAGLLSIRTFRSTPSTPSPSSSTSTEPLGPPDPPTSRPRPPRCPQRRAQHHPRATADKVKPAETP